MSFFTSSPRPPKGSGRWTLLSLAVITLGSMVVLPTGYVIERPGQVFNVMGEISGQKVISSSDLEVYESESRFDVTTVSLLGNRESTPSWVQVLWAWADPEQIVLPLDEVYPPNLTTAEIRAESTAQMEVSQQDAIAAALSEMGYEIPRTLYVASVIADAPSSGILVAGDFVVSAGGMDVSTFDELKSQIQLSEGLPIVIEVVRDGQPRALEITPEKRETDWVIGAMVGYTYDFPVDIQLQLGDVGGPSGGLMFSLGILDALSEGSMAGGLHVSGTGTITAAGEVGPIGGVGLKMIAAKNSGADLFLVPEGNCEEAIGQIPEGLTVVTVRDLNEALGVIEALRDGNQLPSISCN
ncbi:MAG: S16 family serine protease [Aquiluna sp.]